jgi:hypothetical protein
MLIPAFAPVLSPSSLDVELDPVSLATDVALVDEGDRLVASDEVLVEEVVGEVVVDDSVFLAEEEEVLVPSQVPNAL